ncbi:MAG: CsbD family protein [Microthrixaceae bacterium]
MRLGSIDVNKLRGISDKAVGLGKELVGTLTGNERLQDAGEAQQERATQELRTLRAEVKAEQKDAKAQMLEQRQKAAANAKR